MNRIKWSEAVVLAALVTAGVTLRLALRDIPNFAPVAAIALFAGYYFRSRAAALAVPIATMAISDCFLPGYAWQHMVVVYGMLAFPVLMRGPLRKHLKLSDASFTTAAGSMAGLLGCSFLGSVLFFVVTNALCLGWYEPTLQGVVHCYVQALPFFRYTLAGDMAFALLTFGGYAVALRLAESQAAKPASCAA
ncbi:MAG: hypothetical protein KDA41_16505 [Planctomycetales bacterium]|nr:hypothetical protein [Planctomycetales bacterium]